MMLFAPESSTAYARSATPMATPAATCSAEGRTEKELRTQKRMKRQLTWLG